MAEGITPELLVRDVAASLAFYGALGFAVRHARPEEGFACVEREGAVLMLERLAADGWLTGPMEPPFGRGINLEIGVSDVAALRAACPAPVFREVEEVWYRVGAAHVGVRQFLVQDPDGYLLRFQQDIGRRADLPPDFRRGDVVAAAARGGGVPIRGARPGDAPAMSAIYRASVEALGPRRYSAAQVAAWAALTPTPDDFRAIIADGRRSLVAVDGEDRATAFADLRPDGLINFFYAAPTAAGTGVAAALCAAVEAEARALGLTRLRAEASEVARGFFERRGFAARARRDFDVGGVAIHNWAMEKAL